MALIHGGPFANIAHGCNSLFATKTAMNIGEYTITEAGFGSDLGGEKFLDIVCHNGKIQPNMVVLVVSIRSLKMHGLDDTKKVKTSDTASLLEGIKNLKQHISNIRAFNLPMVVAINQFNTDTDEEKQILRTFLEQNKVPYSFTTLFAHGSIGAIDLAKKVIQLASHKSKHKPVYKLSDKLEDKIYKIVTRCYGATGVEYSSKAKTKLKQLNNTKA
jgi:formate--tetrahydrofolate ligase